MTPVKRQDRQSPQKDTRAKKKKLPKAKALREHRSLVRFGISSAVAAFLSLSFSFLLIQCSGTERLVFSEYEMQDLSVNTAFAQTFRTDGEFSAGTLEQARQTLSDTHVLYTIPSGRSVDRICEDLEVLGIIGPSSKGLLTEQLISQSYDRFIKAGTYLFPYEIHTEAAAIALIKGFTDIAVLTIYDGMTITQIDDMLTAKGLSVAGELREEAESIARASGFSFSEGTLLSGVYAVSVTEAPAGALAEIMHQSMLDALNSLLKGSSDPAAERRSLEQLLIIASMIQRETAEPEQMPVIAGIISNRLEEGMPLGIDATTRYETGNWSDPITAEDLRSTSPYNTRIHPGLPPSGIGTPGTAALAAACEPADVPYFYYLHDRSGGFHPAITYAEHLENVERYLR